MPPKGYRLYGPERGWTEDQLIYMSWIVWPVTEKDPDYLTKKEFAELLKVDEDTLRNWEKIPGWDDAVQAMGQKAILDMDYLFLRNIAENMLSRNPSDKIIQTYFRWIKPAILKNRPSWERLLMQRGEKSLGQEDKKQQLIAEMMQEPVEVRDKLLGYFRRLTAEQDQGEAEVLPAAKNVDFKRKKPADMPEARVKAVASRQATLARAKAKPLTLLPIIPPIKSRQETDEE